MDGSARSDYGAVAVCEVCIGWDESIDDDASSEVSEAADSSGEGGPGEYVGGSSEGRGG